MKKNAIKLLFSLVLLAGSAATANAQDSPATRNEFWPEINVYIKLSPRFRLFFLGTVSRAREGGGSVFGDEPFEGQAGVHLDFIPNKHMILRAGYRYGTSLNGADPFKEHRILTEQTFRKALPGKLLLSDRNREDFRFVDGEYSFRYRNRVTLEREFVIKEHSITPYTSGELYYDTRFDTWNRNRYAFGIQIPLKRRRSLLNPIFPRRQVILDLYYMRQNDSRSETTHVNAIGMVWAIHF